ncbi:hypothetical protein [Methylovulum psychrotolerans]|uniref:hypothetical protein n=1 Tax=Methylovulum psychrotolerans TaxID=1704499 RepID=UPI0011B03F10|nr:hypothetical protein [Methylovulum psychrotolerans]
MAASGGSKDAIVVSHSHNVNDHNHSITDEGHSHDVTGYKNGDFQAPNDVYTVTSNGSEDDTNLNSTSSNATGISIDNATGLTTQDTGSSGVNANLPPYYALAYIMLIS